MCSGKTAVLVIMMTRSEQKVLKRKGKENMNSEIVVSNTSHQSLDFDIEPEFKIPLIMKTILKVISLQLVKLVLA
jgi:hypothetical protein